MSHPPTIRLDRPPARLLLCLGLALVAFFVLGAGRAAATITSSQVTSPATTTFGIDPTDVPSPMVKVSGETNSTEPAHDAIDLICFGNGGEVGLAFEVPLAPDGSFSTEFPSYELYGACRIRAIPSPAGAAPPPDLARFAGPLSARGYASTYRVSEGPGAGRIYNFNVHDQQLSAADEFDSIGSCGYSGGYLFNPALEETTYTFSCSDFFWRVADEEEETGSRSEMQVDGVDAYFPAAAKSVNSQAPGLPQVTRTFHQDPANGDLTIEDTEQLVACNTTAFPPDHETCTAFHPTGVVDTRTIEQTEDGHLVTVTDHYSSSDGASHGLDMLNQQYLRFGQPFAAHYSLGIRFPGQSAYASHALGDVVPIPAAAPGVIYVRQEGKTDGNEESGRGAIVFDHPASSATFNEVGEVEAGFYLHQTATVPASGATTFRFAYAQSYDQGTVERLAARAAAAFADPAAPMSPVTTGGSGTPTGAATGPTSKPGPASGSPGAPSGRFVIGRVALDRGAGTAKLTVVAPEAGSLVLSGPGVHTVRRRVGGAGPIAVPVAPNAALAARLRRSGHARTLVEVAFTPSGGSPTSRARTLVHLRAIR